MVFGLIGTRMTMVGHRIGNGAVVERRPGPFGLVRGLTALQHFLPNRGAVDKSQIRAIILL